MIAWSRAIDKRWRVVFNIIVFRKIFTLLRASAERTTNTADASSITEESRLLSGRRSVGHVGEQEGERSVG